MDLEEALVMKEDGTFEWKTCAYMTTRKRNMINHNRVHSPSIYKCQSEGCAFKTKVKSHMRIHEEAKHKGVRIDCNFCVIIRWPTGKILESTSRKNTQVGLPLLPGLVISVISKLWTTTS